MATLNIYSAEWLDVVFSDRNRVYGAYDLRKNNSKSTYRALIAGSALFILCVAAPSIIKQFGITQSLPPDQRIIEVLNPPTLDPKTPPPANVEPPKSRVDQIEFPPPVAVPESEATDNPPTIADLKIADPGTETIKGDINGDILIDIPAGTGPAPTKDDKIVESNQLYSRESVQVLPKFPGGPEAWARFMQGYRYPEAAVASGIAGTVYVSFVVEKDGSLTDIRVSRDAGYGTGEEAVRLLKTSAKWSPGIQNGKPVRVAYTQPITLNIRQ